MITKFHLSVAMMAVSMTGCQAVATQTMTGADGIRQVSQVRWDKTGKAFVTPNESNLIASEARIVFVRPLDKDGLQTSVNIGIDDRFQVSLQPGQYSQVVTCAGNHSIGAEVTGKKNNILTDKSPVHNLAAQRTHYYMVVVDEAGQPSIRPITVDQALSVLNHRNYQAQEQTHQISRVVENCIGVTPPLVPVITPVTKVDDDLEINTSIKLDVLFDFDSANIKSDYNQRLENMVKFMQINTDISAILEGHTDSKGPANYNLQLSQARANAVKAMLVNKYGADDSRLTTVGYGESRPVDTNDTAQGRQNNRRVTAIINQNNK